MTERSVRQDRTGSPATAANVMTVIAPIIQGRGPVSIQHTQPPAAPSASVSMTRSGLKR